MLTSERQRLISTMSPDAVRASRILKCGICLALVTLLMVIGSFHGKEEVANDAHAQAGHSESAAKATTAAAHRKEVFDARRVRFEAGHDAAGITLVPSAEASVPVAPGSSELDRSASPTRNPSRSVTTVITPPSKALSDGTSTATCSGGGDGGMDATGNQCNE